MFNDFEERSKSGEFKHPDQGEVSQFRGDGAGQLVGKETSTLTWKPRVEGRMKQTKERITHKVLREAIFPSSVGIVPLSRFI